MGGEVGGDRGGAGGDRGGNIGTDGTSSCGDDGGKGAGTCGGNEAESSMITGAATDSTTTCCSGVLSNADARSGVATLTASAAWPDVAAVMLS